MTRYHLQQRSLVMGILLILFGTLSAQKSKKLKPITIVDQGSFLTGGTMLLLGYGCNNKISTLMNLDPTFPKENKVTNTNFTGNVYVQMFTQNDTVHNVSIGSVTFEPGARTNWHVHLGGQILMVADGIGYYQERGSMIRKMRKGDVIKCPHNIEHWYGASPTTSVTHIAISTNTQLGEAKCIRTVTHEEYNVKIID